VIWLPLIVWVDLDEELFFNETTTTEMYNGALQLIDIG